MPFLRDDATFSRLILVKQIYNEAQKHVRGGQFRTDRLIAIILFDLAIETVLKAVVYSTDSIAKPDSDLARLIDQANISLKSINQVVPFRTQTLNIRELRNYSQHEATPPDPNRFIEAQVHAREFLEKLVFTAWGRSFESISLVDAVGSVPIQEALMTAQISFENGDFKHAIEMAALGLERSIISVEHSVVGDRVQRLSISASDLEALVDSVSRLRRLVLFVVLGLNLIDYATYKKIAGDFILNDWSYERYRFGNAKDNPTREDAELVVNYCIETVLHIQEKIGDLEKPFGLVHGSLFRIIE